MGAGETVELVARHLIEAGVSRIVIANRTLGRARELAQKFGAEAVLLAEIPEQLLDADIVITSTASQLPILGKGAVEQALKVRKHRPFLMVDIAVPRDIEAQVGDLRDVYLYSVDDLREIVDQNMRSRRSEARKADVIIDEGVHCTWKRCAAWRRGCGEGISPDGRAVARAGTAARPARPGPGGGPPAGTGAVGARPSPTN